MKQKEHMWSKCFSSLNVYWKGVRLYGFHIVI